MPILVILNKHSSKSSNQFRSHLNDKESSNHQVSKSAKQTEADIARPWPLASAWAHRQID